MTGIGSPTAFAAGLGGALLIAGAIGAAAGLIPSPERPDKPRRGRGSRPLRAWRGLDRRTRIALASGFAAGVVVALLTGWLVAVPALPLLVVGLPALLAPPSSALRTARLEALEEWTRGLSGVLTVGVGLEQALVATLRSTPEAIRPEVTRLANRLGARWTTEAALRAFADDVDDATGDLVAANLILGARRRGAGLASMLEALASSVAEDVRARRQIEADRAKPRATARWVTLFTVGVLGVLALTGTYVAPFGSPVGQIVLTLLLGLYVACLVWMRRMAVGASLPRFLVSESAPAATQPRRETAAGVRR